MAEWILIWTFFCRADYLPECKYYHKSNLTFAECSEMLADKDHIMRYEYDRYIPHIIYCTNRPELREKVREHNRKYHPR